MLVLIFLAIAALLSFLVCAGSLTVLKFALCLLGFFLAVNIVYILWCFAACLQVKDMEKPIEKINGYCRRAMLGAFKLVAEYMGVDLTLSGMEKLPEGQRFLLVCNHRSGFDPVVLMHALRKHELATIAKPSIMALPVIGKVAYAIGCLSIDRDNDRNALKTNLTAANYLKKDVCSICIFPEGTRSRTGELLPFHAGSFKIAQRAGAPLVIASIEGTERVTKNLPFKRTAVNVKILEVIPAEDVKARDTQELAAYSRKLIGESFAEVQA